MNSNFIIVASPLQKLPLFDLAYQMPDLSWVTMSDLTPWAANYLIEACLNLSRQVKIRRSDGRVESFSPVADRMARRLLLLDLFLIPVSGRCGSPTDNE